MKRKVVFNNTCENCLGPVKVVKRAATLFLSPNLFASFTFQMSGNITFYSYKYITVKGTKNSEDIFFFLRFNNKYKVVDNKIQLNYTQII